MALLRAGRDDLAVVPVGVEGKVDVFHAGGRSHVTVDVVGWLDGG